MKTSKQHLGLGSGMGLVAGSMIGTGVFVSAGYMAQELSAGWILVAWLVGGLLAAAGALSYGELARRIPRSGGEYRYLHELLHPWVGIVAGWSSLVFGFSAPVAINALAAAEFSSTLWPHDSPRLVAAAFIFVPTVVHALDNTVSRRVQNVLAAAKVALVIGFVGAGLALGKTTWPAWSPPNSDGFAISAFVTGLFFVGFAYTGWNSSAYAASEFRHPGRDVPRSMLLGLVVVGLLYLVINWIFVANVRPAEAGSVLREGAAVTLGHVIASQLVGDAGATIMSVVMILAFVSAISSLTVLGPRVYAEMSADNVLPSVLGYRDDANKPPTASVLFQGAASVGLLVSHSLREVLVNASAVLLLFTALCAAGLIRLRYSSRLRERFGCPPMVPVVAAMVYALASVWMLLFAFREQPSMLGWLALASALPVGSTVLVGRFSGGARGDQHRGA